MAQYHLDPVAFGKVAVLMGGQSSERDVSLQSGSAVLEALHSLGVEAHGFDTDSQLLQRLQVEKVDRAFIALHGRGGEDGTLQGALEMLKIPYTGSGVLGCAIGMDKWRTKQLWLSQQLPTPKAMLVQNRSDCKDVIKRLGLPLVIKPTHEGSSIGISKVNMLDEMLWAWDKAFQYDPEIMAEEWIAGKEFTVALLKEEALPIIRVEPPGNFFDYEAKYISDETRYHCPSGLSSVEEVHLQTIAKKAFSALSCRGWGRIDFMLDANQSPWLLEVNTVPGMTGHSLVPMAARAANIAFPELVLQILETSL